MTFIFLSVVFGSCGYKLAQPELYQSYQTFEVPYVKGDVNGLLTSQIISALSSKTNFRYVQSHRDLILKAEVISKDWVHIGFQYDRRANGTLINRLVPNEGRSLATVKVEILHPKTEEVLYGPFEVFGGADFDFVNSDTYRDLSFIDQRGVTRSVLPFSLGQLNSWQEATDTASSVLYRVIAEKIIEGIQNL